ncbi:hypothetical protein evm_013677 [Chilo suppressalis]|nr:hypothetical protein evm_013677 [Chilo suppressalis]
MHSSETLAAPPSTGPNLLLELGRLIVRSRSRSPPPSPAPAPAPSPHDRLLQAKLRAARPSTSHQIQTQPKSDVEECKPGVEGQLSDHVQALWTDQIPVCIEVLLAGECSECRRVGREEPPTPQAETHPRGVLLERWTMHTLPAKSNEAAFTCSAWLLNAVRSQLHFSQLRAWRMARVQHSYRQHRRKLSRETCNIKKIEANCDQDELDELDELDEFKRKLNVLYSVRTPGDTYHANEFQKTPISHQFPVTDIGGNVHLKVVLESLPRVDEIPNVKCTCQKRRASKEMPVNIHEELTGKLNDLTIGNRIKFPTDLINSNTGNPARRLSIVTNAASTEYLYTSDEKDEKNKVLDDRMLTPCSENGKHKCNCDEESDGREMKSFTSVNNEPKKLDERRLREIAKYKRRLRKESKLKKLSDSTSSEGDKIEKAKETHTSIPILQASRFDRLRAIGCYRNQTYLTLPASRIETKSPFVDAATIQPDEIKKTCTVGTQTDNVACSCGSVIEMKCDSCVQNRLVRSEANYDLASLDGKNNGARRKREDEAVEMFKKPKCDNICSGSSIHSEKCDNLVVTNVSFGSDVVKRPKIRRYQHLMDRIDRVVEDRSNKDIEELHLKTDDTVFSVPKRESKRQKTFSINDDEYVRYEKCDYGTFEKYESDQIESPVDQNGFKFPEVRKGQENLVPSPSETDRFRFRFDSAASMVFHTKTGLPLTSSPAPLRRGNNCFDFDDSINGISGIKSALFHPGGAEEPPSCPLVPPGPATPPSPLCPPSPVSSSPQPTATKKESTPKLRMGPSTGLLGSFEESALKGRLEPVATVQGFTAELAASGAFCAPHRRLPVTVFFYACGATNAPYMGHINLGPSGYRVSRSGTIQVSLFNPHGTLVKMFVVLYDLTKMPPRARTFLRQRTLYLPASAPAPPPHLIHKWLRYLIHLRFMTSKSGKLYLHTDIRIIVSRKADLDTATAHSIFRPITAPSDDNDTKSDGETKFTDGPSKNADAQSKTADAQSKITDAQSKTADAQSKIADGASKIADGIGNCRGPNRVFGGSSEHDTEAKRDNNMLEICYENGNGVAFELRSFTYAPENPKYSPRLHFRCLHEIWPNFPIPSIGKACAPAVGTLIG